MMASPSINPGSIRANDKENGRMRYDSVLSPRVLREIYLMPFMLAQKHAKPWSIMTAYALFHIRRTRQ
jgi:beta-glucosidase